MERSKLFELMDELKLYGMKAAFDEIMATAIKRQHEPQRIIGDLLKAETSEKQARSIKYQLTIAKLPLAKDLDGFEFSSRISLAADSSPSSATPSWSAEPAPASPISPSPLLEAASDPACAAGSITSSTSSTASKQKRVPVARAGSLII